MRRYYAVRFAPNGRIQLVKALNDTVVLAEKPLNWEVTKTYKLALEINGPRLRGWVDDVLVFDLTDTKDTLTDGTIGLIVEEGRCAYGPVTVGPWDRWDKPDCLKT